MSKLNLQTADVIHNVEQRLPPDFPSHIRDAIFEGLEKQAGKILSH